MSVGDRIKKRRIELGMSVDELASMLEKSRATIYRYENGDIENLPVTVLEPIAIALQTSPAHLMGWEEKNTFPIERVSMHPVVSSVAAGYNMMAMEQFEGFEPAYDINNPEQCVWFLVTGDSMAPDIKAGDYALVRRQPTLENGDIGVIIFDGEHGTIKKYQRHENAISLIPTNPAYEPRVIVGEEMSQVIIYGKVIETKRKW